MHTETDDLVAKIDSLHAKKDAWTKVGVDARVALLEKIAKGVEKVAPAWVAAVCKIKGIDPDSQLVGEEWLAGPVTTQRNVRLLIETLREGGERRVTTKKRPDGQWVATVFPLSLIDRLMLGGVRADVWMMPGEPPSRGRIYRGGDTTAGRVALGEGRVSLVLGGGNVSSIPAMDVLYKLFAENDVVLLKMNPVNEVVGPFLEEAFAPLVSEGYLAVVYGGADVGAAAAKHEKVGSLHVTGSDRTYDAIVWGGTAEEREERKKKNEKANEKPFSAELGCVTPILVVPGPWSERDIAYQARHVAAMVTQNGSFNCNAAKVIVLARGWLQREAFLSALEAALAKAAPRKAYYPGADARFQKFREAYPAAKELGQSGEGVVPWTLIHDVPAKTGEYALTNEAFCGVLAVVTLDLADMVLGKSVDPSFVTAKHFLARAVPFANESCWGTLSCALLVHPDTARAEAAAIDNAVAELRYGGIGVNCWPGLIYGLAAPTWGAFPGADARDITSGEGVVHNTFLFDHPQKSVVYAPFRPFVTPPYFSDNTRLREIAEALFKFECAPSLSTLLSVAGPAMKGA